MLRVPLQVTRGPGGDVRAGPGPQAAGRVSGGLDDMMISLYAHGMSVGDGLPDHRPCAGGGEGLAAEAPGPGLRGGVPRRDRGQGPRAGAGGPARSSGVVTRIT